ncbi:putative glucan 1,3-beta-glucosidase A [Carex rostrata]
MVQISHSHWIYLIIISSCLVTLSSSASLPVKAVNLGGWLITEGWITPSLFDNIPNKDMLDGTQLHLKSVTLNMYLSAEGGGDSIIVANRARASDWETFKLWRVNERTFYLRVSMGQFVRISSRSSRLVAKATNPSTTEAFVIVRNSNNRVRIRAPNGLFVQAKTAVSVTADYTEESTSWGNDDPSVFEMTMVRQLQGESMVGQLQGEFQITNGYGTEAATTILRNHWSTYIVEDDFRFIANNGLNAVRIPVGWWIASDPNPPKPFVGGSLQALDNAFTWAEKYNLGVIVDLHAAPGSQNGFEHSASRDGSQEWGTTDENIAQTVNVIDFLASRYAKRSGLLAIELISEPLAPKATLDSLKKYYQEGYNVVRKYTSNAYVIMSNRLSASSTELLQFASGFQKSVLDVHYYNLFTSEFTTMTVQQNIDYVNNNRSTDISTVSIANGPLVFVGEWTAEWDVNGATQQDYQRFAQAQLNVYGRATFGWAYWTLKNVNNHWSLEWMIQNGYISLK